VILPTPQPELAAFNRRWEARLAQFRRHAGPPWWAPGLVLDAEIRNQYERYLPVRLFLNDLAALAVQALPHPSWVPRRLRPSCAPCAGCAAPPPVPSLPDLWALLPDALAGQVTIAEAALLPLLCALADPPRFGTDFGRYPEQLRGIAEFAAARAASGSLRLLDLGCGTGQGTREVAAAVAEASGRVPQAVGVTPEPLEVWMAMARRLPHDPARERRLVAYSATHPVHFLVGDATAVPSHGGFDLVLANGLVGGVFLRTPHQLAAFFQGLGRLLAPNGRVTLANRFHEGELPHVAEAADFARGHGWAATGEPRLLWLRRT
jgi:SAM-dependent methyltransferase